MLRIKMSWQAICAVIVLVSHASYGCIPQDGKFSSLWCVVDNSTVEGQLSEVQLNRIAQSGKHLICKYKFTKAYRHALNVL